MTDPAGGPSPEELRRLLHEWNATAVDHAPGATVHALFEAQAQRRPDAVAVVDAQGQTTYAQLDARANRVAQRLVQEGVKPDARVAVCLERSAGTVAAVLGILKAGGAYLPLEPSYPAERLAFMLEDAGANVILTERALAPLFASAAAKILLLEDVEAAGSALAPDAKAHSSAQLAYVMYTSGSTGKPKGVEIPHRAINRLVCKVGYTQLTEATVLLHAAPLAFDASTFEIWGALLNGGRVVCYPDRVPTSAGLRKVIAAHGITTVWLTAALFNALVDEDARCLMGVKHILTGGEALSVTHVRRAQQALPEVLISNAYGPTECTTFAATYAIPRPVPPGAKSIPIGRPIRDTRLYILDEQRQPVRLGAEGELYIGGAGVARGYLGRPELTQERFLADPFVPGERIYRTGDRVRYLPDGAVDFLGRADKQVKIRGFRIELGEIEAGLLAHPALQSCAVLAREDVPGVKRLVAYLCATAGASPVPAPELRALLLRTLPDYMVPVAWVWLPALPITGNGKLDVRALPSPDRSRPELSSSFLEPRTPTEQRVCQVWAGLLDVDRVGVEDNFFELGGTSLLAVKAAAELGAKLGAPLPAVQLFQSPTPRGLAAWYDGSKGTEAPLVGGDATARAKVAQPSGGRLADVAIIGMAGRFPGAPDVDALWKNLLGGVEAVTWFREDEVDPLVPASLRQDPAYVRARAIIDGVDQFDAAFFGVNPKEAELMDPQQRLFLEVCWQALERSGYSPDTAGGLVGVFGGVYNNGYYAQHVLRRPDLVERVGAFQVMVGNEKDYVATRVAHRLNLQGPALSVHSACSTSLVATCEAVKSLQLGECDLALAGGASINVPVKSGYLYQEGGMLSSDGHCRPFDHRATGTTFSDGVGVVALKRLSDAQRDGDHIHAIIRGAAVNNDGGNKASFTAPSVEGQAAVVALAQARAQVSPRDISYVEAHGTATPLGDPIEVAGLTRAFRQGTSDTGFCALGSVKSNFGHLVIAAGVTGLIKTALSLEHEVIPATLHYEQPNPKIDFAQSPFVVAAQQTRWPRAEKPRFAGVSSFGVGGTNAHVVLEEPPPAPLSSPSRPKQLLLLSARSPAALDAQSKALAAFLLAHPDVALADVAWTLQTGRSTFAHRKAVVCRTHEDAAKALTEGDPQRVFARKSEALDPEVAFLFPGQGAQYVGMGRALHTREAAFRDAVDECSQRLLPHLGRDLREVLYAPEGNAEAATATLKDTSITQPALFVTSYAMARWWMSVGVRPAAMIGHSVGEFVAACLAGVFTLEDALKLVAVRGRLMGAQPRGSMLSVRMAAPELQKRLAAFPGAEIATDNGPTLCVAAGPTPVVEQLEKALQADRVACKLLHTSHAFHTGMMDAAVPPFLEVVRSVKLLAPTLPIVSTATGEWLTPEEATNPEYWARHLRAQVRFSAGAATLLKRGPLVGLEVGPRGTLVTLMRQQISDKARQPTTASMPDSAGEDAEYGALLGAAGQLWLAGARMDFRAFHAAERRRRVALPTYPFERQRFWADASPEAPAPAPVAVSNGHAVPNGKRALLQEQLRVMQQQLLLLASRRSNNPRGNRES